MAEEGGCRGEREEIRNEKQVIAITKKANCEIMITNGSESFRQGAPKSSGRRELEEEEKKKRIRRKRSGNFPDEERLEEISVSVPSLIIAE